MLDKLRTFRHFIRHAYDCELDEGQLREIQTKLLNDFDNVTKDFQNFRLYIEKLSD